MFVFNPYNWYWRADDGRLFSSKSLLVVADDNSDYIAWLGGPMAQVSPYPTIWPRDETGAQTKASLQEVFTPYGLTIPA